MSWNRLDSTEGSVSILLLTCIPCSELPQFQHSISNTQKTYADSGHKHVPPCWEIKKIKKKKRERGKKTTTPKNQQMKVLFGAFI